MVRWWREGSDYASSSTISSIQIGLVSVNMADNSNDDLRRYMDAQEQTFRTQHEALDNIQCILAQLLTNQNNKETSGNHVREEKNLNKEFWGWAFKRDILNWCQSHKRHPCTNSISRSVEWDEEGRMTRPYPVEWIQFRIHQNSSRLR